MEIDIKNIKKSFFIGIGGIGISALAKMMQTKGLEVSGVNDEEGKTVDSLREEGIKVILLDDFKNLPEADLYVYSDAWLYRGPEIIAEAKKTGKPVLSYFEALGEVAKEYKVIAVAGTHGKTTTTAMLAEIMIDAGLDPAVVVGSFVKKFGSNFRAGKGEYLVVEADEYNRHFLNFHPYLSVITNIEADHLDYYKDLADVQNAFDTFISQSAQVITEKEYKKYLEKATASGGAPQHAGVPKLLVPGEHNRMNAAAALAAAAALGIPLESAQKSLAGFSGTWRRLEKLGATTEGVIIYDDYAHHPTEIRASLAALRELYPSGQNRLFVLFQPHLYSRTKAFFDEFSKSFSGADWLGILPVYFAREAPDESVSSRKLAELAARTGLTAEGFDSFDEAEGAVKALNLKDGDIFVTMGAGEAYKVAQKVFKIVQ
jgi:UDP-N-acetylmuramate--alanine ligase